MTADPLCALVSKLDDIGPLAQAVAGLRQSTIEQEAEALDAILEKIRPLLAVVARPVQVAYHDSGEQFSTEHKEYHDKRGLVLLNPFSQECYDRGTRGAYTGYQLILWQDGSLACLERVGEWSRWQGEPSGWYINKEEELSTEQAVRRFGLAVIVEGLADEIVDASERLKSQQADYEARLAMIARIREVVSNAVEPDRSR